MIKNYLRIAYRSLVKNGFFTALNLFGLSIGIAVSLALFLFVQYEYSFDKYHQKTHQIHKLGIDVEFNDTQESWGQVPNIAGPIFEQKISEVVRQTRLLKHNFGQTAFVSVDNQQLVEKDFFWADSSIFQILDIPFIHGDPETALKEPNSIVLSHSVSDKIFGPINPVGKVLKVDNSLELKITGVYADFPDNSSINAHMLGSIYTLKWASQNLVWSNCSFDTYLLLHESADPDKTVLAMNAVLDDAVEESNRWFSFWLQPMTDMHLHSKGISNNNYAVNLSDIRTVRLLSGLALAILLIACFNYINMTTARSQSRIREVGISKTLGATRMQMIRRFLMETGILAILAIGISIFIADMGLPYFRELTGRNLNLAILFDFRWVGAMLLLWLGVTLAAGMYPALVLSSFTPGKLLNPGGTPQISGSFFRKVLVIMQFSICIALIAGIIIFKQQLQFISQKELGFLPDQVLAINTSGAEENSQVNSLMNAYRNMAPVKSLCKAQGYPGASVSGYSMSKPDNQELSVLVQSNRVSPGFDEVLGLKYLAGKSFGEKSKEDTTVQVVVNESGVKFLGWTPEESIGKSPPKLFNARKVQITGVVEDFHHSSMHSPISPYVFQNGNGLGQTPYLLLKLETSDLKSSLVQMELEFKNHLPQSAFEFTFLDQHTSQLYAGEERLSRIVLVFTILAIVISCLGLFGLAAYSAEKRNKEIGIRKVLGASPVGLAALLSKDFLKLVVIAMLVGSPTAYYFMSSWLDGFAYRIDIRLWMFIWAGAIAMAIAILSVGYQSVRAAIANPINSLRTE